MEDAAEAAPLLLLVDHEQRVEHPDVIYRSEREKYTALADEIEQLNRWDVLVLKDEIMSWEGLMRAVRERCVQTAGALST